MTGVRIAVEQEDEVDEDGGEIERVKALSEEELRALLDALDPRWRLSVEFIAHMGLRIGEAVALQWRHIDFGRRCVLVRRRWYRGAFGKPKSKYGRRDVPISVGMAQKLWPRRGRPGELVFTTMTGRMVDPKNSRTRVLKAGGYQRRTRRMGSGPREDASR